ncbi:DUF402 domain-containing protein [Tamaricihabitans halophyticus]|nr:DUF402 domain-containing protein [Tamaricihabitans halophyticus]
MSSEPAAIHPPKIEIFDISNNTNTDPKGVVRAVDEYRVEPYGLYLARATPGRTQFHYLESWLLPDLGLRVTDFWFNPGHARPQDFYLDIVRIERDAERWRSTDLYLDLTVRAADHRLAVLDTDELLAALRAELIDTATASYALEAAYRAIHGLAAHGYDLPGWLATTGCPTSWRRRVSRPAG